MQTKDIIPVCNVGRGKTCYLNLLLKDVYFFQSLTHSLEQSETRAAQK